MNILSRRLESVERWVEFYENYSYILSMKQQLFICLMDVFSKKSLFYDIIRLSPLRLCVKIT
ncbi:hypothetical protein [Serpentinicella alkaliphila]|uniref:hypothetical protein n=1 Tax=Serpentinicella alkaliphila TaxID=1734049 RepID=UPI0010434B73|nr:hypothetical protein [Serpentinicella alkaliphila]QUH26878.1 hypothetical protein HZR23_14865 [Serpentinicella alkaliphila]